MFPEFLLKKIVQIMNDAIDPDPYPNHMSFQLDPTTFQFMEIFELFCEPSPNVLVSRNQEILLELLLLNEF